MTTISIGDFANRFLDASNTNKKNDYRYHSGWNPEHVLGQQYGIWLPEARALKDAIEEGGYFTDPMLPDAKPTDLRPAILSSIHYLTTPAAAREMPQGSVDLSENAAKFLTNYAKELGMNLKFSGAQNLPLHPVG